MKKLCTLVFSLYAVACGGATGQVDRSLVSDHVFHGVLGPGPANAAESPVPDGTLGVIVECSGNPTNVVSLKSAAAPDTDLVGNEMLACDGAPRYFALVPHADLFVIINPSADQSAIVYAFTVVSQ